MGVPPNHPFLDGIFHEINHPAIRDPPFMETHNSKKSKAPVGFWEWNQPCFVSTLPAVPSMLRARRYERWTKCWWDRSPSRGSHVTRGRDQEMGGLVSLWALQLCSLYFDRRWCMIYYIHLYSIWCTMCDIYIYICMHVCMSSMCMCVCVSVTIVFLFLYLHDTWCVI